MPEHTDFVSYSSRDRDRVKKILAVKGHDLDGAFLDSHELRIADSFAQKIRAAIAGCERFHLCWSRTAADSEWVERELAWALERYEQLGRPSGFLHVYRLDGTEIPDRVRSAVHVADVRDLFGSGAPEVTRARLPTVSSLLFGRDRELALLDQAWEDPGTQVLQLVAFGGVGKTALVHSWLNRMQSDGYRGAERVFGWSFYSQGAEPGRQVSADPFLAEALAWFGDEDPTAGSSWQKGERLAGLVRRHRTLLVLDGMEPLQYSPAEGRPGALREPGMQALVRELAAEQPGLCVITTRVAVEDLAPYLEGSARLVDLDDLAPEAGAALLRELGVERGTEEELRRASEEFGGRALALTLLGTYLARAHRGDVARRDRVPALTREPKHGGHARRVMESYEALFSAGPELQLLRLLGLFDRPAPGEQVAALRAEPPIPALTDRLVPLSEDEWAFAVASLRDARLLAAEDPAAPGAVDAHPLVREHFAEGLESEHPEAWQAGHERLYRHLTASAEEQPDTLEGLAPLFAAVRHGCEAGRHQEALDDVYWRRINRGREFYSTQKLGAFGSDLAALASLFDPPWSRPVGTLTAPAHAFLLNAAAFRLRALGRLEEAVEPFEASLDSCRAQEDWKEAAIRASNLSELHLARGAVQEAVDRAAESVEFAEKSGDAFQRVRRRTTLADALHQAGDLDRARELFAEAEALQAQYQPAYPLLYSLQGYQYCDLLLAQGEAEEVRRRATQSLEWSTQQRFLLDIALDHLSLGRAALALGDREAAAAELDRALEGLREAGTQHHLPRGLLARVELALATGDHPRARADLQESLTLTWRAGLKLHEADTHLGLTRLHLAEGDLPAARTALDAARELVTACGYRRREGEVEALARQLAEAEASA